MERSYFIFYGYALAYCINMLFAWQVENLSISSLAVHHSTAPSYCFYEKGNSTGYSDKDKIPAVSNTSVKMSRPYAEVLHHNLLKDVEFTQQHKFNTCSIGDPKSLSGFYSIIEFPDKLS